MGVAHELGRMLQDGGIEAGSFERGPHHLGIVHLLRLGPHVAEHLLDVATEYALELRSLQCS
jgi:hypothetical protein